MLKAFLNAVKIPDLRKKLVFTLMMIFAYRLGSWIPVPGVDVAAIRGAQAGGAGGFLGILNVFAGGALAQLAVFALGVMPYITASIIMQLLGVVIPKLEQLQKEGEQGRRKITQYTRYLTMGLAVLQSTALISLASTGALFGGTESVLVNDSPWLILFMVLTLTAGTAVIMWLAELITNRGVGNGMSLLIYVSILSQFPSQLRIVRTDNLTGLWSGWGLVAVVLAVGVIVTFAVVFMEQGQRRIPVQYARRTVGRRSYGGQSTYIPLKVNQSGVIPIIFAASLMALPQLLGQITSWQWLDDAVARWFDTTQGIGWVYIATFAVLTLFFTYFYAAIAFNPIEVADNMKKYGGFIPGIRPGRQTAEYLDKVLSRLTLPGSLYLVAVAVMPFVAFAVFDISQFPLGGASLLIMVGVALETMKQIEGQLMQHNYEGFLA
ncbi:preprotein translocase subunit SecY [Salsipaludibacter albus]|uniref:preprotein translocase subunit SecY n=1 Tax=Salsipaludibacter albus TaxID=2849650 RepID=UPI001EE4EADE|nr:preprotein translocase subunit SecY [Salsipaludibacter albus]MBY5161582.1 preprotein translocase subunit SecY [Salsipaludibacter albus]